jgi:membrane-associated phospholipid phosphatase
MTTRWRRWATAATVAWTVLTSGCALPVAVNTATEHPAATVQAPAGEDAPPSTPNATTAGPQGVDQEGESQAAAGPLDHGWHILCDDQLNFYTLPHAADLVADLAVAGVLANSTPDRKVSSWYQESIRSRASDNVSTVVKNFGEYSYTLPAMAAVAVAGKLTEDTEIGAAGFEWGTRSLRTVLVGAPMVGILQVGLGASRPEANDSRWHPFRSDHGASGHAFIGAVPFMTAAAMTEEPLFKAAFTAGSFAAGWSRINDNAHYLSQVLLGWAVAYLAVDAVNKTTIGQRVHVAPSVLTQPSSDKGDGKASGGLGVAVSVDY